MNQHPPAQMPDAVMLYAAGFGTRMKELTRDRPKPLIEVAGKPLIEHSLDLARAVAPRRIAANAHYKAEVLKAHLAPLGVEVSHETPEILDSGGGLLQALPLLGNGPVYTSNTDAVWKGPNPFELARDRWNPAEMDGLMVCVPLPRAIGRQGGGDFSADAAGRLSKGGDLVWGGVQILKTENLAGCGTGSFSIWRLWQQMLDAERLFAVEYPGHWCDVGHPGGIRLAEEMIASDV